MGPQGDSGEKMHGISEVDGVTEIAPASVTPAGWKEVFFFVCFHWHPPALLSPEKSSAQSPPLWHPP